MSTRYEIVRYRPEFKHEVAELQRHLWGADTALNAAYLEWKYEWNPYVERPLIYLGLCGSEVVGMRGMFGSKWQVGHPCQTFLALCGSDSVVDPQHRHRGLFRNMVRAALDDLVGGSYAYAFSLSAGSITSRTCRALGWRSTGSLQPVIRACPWNRLPLLLPSTHRNPFYLLDQNGWQREGHISPHISVEQSPRLQAMAELVERIGSNGRVQHVRDQQYFAWRFQNPRCVYRFLFWDDGRLEGYLVLRQEISSRQGGVNVVDWEATGRHARAELLQAALHWCSSARLTIWSATLPDEARAILNDAGFELPGVMRRLLGHPRSVLVRPLRQEILETDWGLASRQLLDLANWDVRMIYSDDQ